MLSMYRIPRLLRVAARPARKMFVAVLEREITEKDRSFDGGGVPGTQVRMFDRLSAMEFGLWS